MEKKTIIAAGGLVTNEQGDLMMIFRRGHWDLPKGKLDEGESMEDCAVREVQEETGASNLQLGKLIGKTYHEYFDKWVGEDVMKETWWYEMKAIGKQELQPQIEEDIEKIVWAKQAEIETYSKNSFANIISIIAKWRQ